jgi:hypothetical protein
MFWQYLLPNGYFIEIWLVRQWSTFIFCEKCVTSFRSNFIEVTGKMVRLFAVQNKRLAPANDIAGNNPNRPLRAWNAIGEIAISLVLVRPQRVATGSASIFNGVQLLFQELT